MGTVLGILSNAIGLIFGSGNQAGSLQEQLSELYIQVGSVIVALANALASNEFQEYGAVKWSATDAKQIGHDLEQIEGDWEANFTRLTDVILPQSFKHLVGYVFSTGITPLRVAMRQAQADITKLTGRVNVLDAWRNSYVDPLLIGWQQFIAWWDNNFSGPALTLIDWLERPADFGTWAAPPIVGPLIGYLATAEHAESRDNLAKIMVAAWYEEPDAIWQLMMQWLLA
jgi:hypothetical protein